MHARGDVEDAETIALAVFERDSASVDANHLLSVSSLQRDDHEVRFRAADHPTHAHTSARARRRRRRNRASTFGRNTYPVLSFSTPIARNATDTPRLVRRAGSGHAVQHAGRDSARRWTVG